MTDDPAQAERWVAHRREHALEKEATVAARENMDRRLEEMNNLREQISRERGAYPTRQEYDAKHEQLVQRVQLLETTLAGLNGRMLILAGLTGVGVSVVVSLILKALNL